MVYRKHFEQFGDRMARLFPELHYKGETIGTSRLPGENVMSKNVTFQVTDDCNLACKYCYQINKGKRRMSFETAKKFVDLLLDADESDKYINPTNSPFIILEFIGGEPFLEVELIDQILTYFTDQAFVRRHPWATRYIISICSNGILYHTERVQRFLRKYKSHLSLSITIDGNKELHDSCRVFHDGTPSYDIAVKAVRHWMNDMKGYMGSKITIAPENITHLCDALIHMIKLGYEEINANCVYEEGWTIEHAAEFYRQTKKFADYMLKNDLDDIYCSLYEENFFHPKSEVDNQNWCGGTGVMLSCDPDGYLYPCIRYMESSLGDKQPAVRIGDVHNGLVSTEKEKEIVKCLNCVTRRTQSTDECYYCPIGEGCSWCSAYNFQIFGTVDKRATYICEMHKARSLANVYYWNKRYEKNGEPLKYIMWCPKEWATPIVGNEEYNYLKKISGGKEFTLTNPKEYTYAEYEKLTRRYDWKM